MAENIATNRTWCHCQSVGNNAHDVSTIALRPEVATRDSAWAEAHLDGKLLDLGSNVPDESRMIAFAEQFGLALA